MDIKHIFASGLLVCGAQVNATEIQYGIVKMDGAGHALLITAEPIDQATTVDIQYPDRDKSACCKRLLATDFKPVQSDAALASNELTQSPARAYAARIPKLWSLSPFIGMAAIGKRIQSSSAHTQLTVRDATGHVRRASTCVSQEGVHLIEKRGAVDRTHLYASLGYEVAMPTCP